MAELSEKRQKFIQSVASNPNASQSAKNIAAKYAASAGTTVQNVASQSKTPTGMTAEGSKTTSQIGPAYSATSFNPPRTKTTTSSIISGNQTTAGGIATGGTPKDVITKTPEQQITTQEIKTTTPTTTMGVTPKAPTTTTQPMTFPTGTQGLRASAENIGLPVGFDAATGQVSIGGKVVDVTGLQRNAQGSYFGTPEQIRSVINQSGVPPTGTQSLREAFAGRSVQYSPETGVVIDGVRIDTSNLPMVGDRFYVTPEQTQSLATQIDEMKSPELKAQDQIAKEQEMLQERQTQLVAERQQLMTGLEQYQSPLSQEVISTIRAAYGNPFQYDPNADQALRQAQTFAERQIMEQLNARGILSSTITRDQLGSLYAELLPKYESIAFERYNQNVDSLLKQANFMMQLSQDDYERYKDFVVQSINGIDEVSRNTVQTAKNNIDAINDSLKNKLQAQKDAAELELKKYNSALDRLDKLGYADSTTAAILGIPVNTPSGQVQRLLLQQKINTEELLLKTKLQIAENEEKAKLDKEKIDYEYRLKLPMEQAKLSLEQAKFAESKRAAQARESIDTARELRLQKEGSVTVQGQTFKKSPYFNMIYDKINNEIQAETEAPGSKKIVKGKSGQIVKNFYQEPGSVEHKRLVTNIMKNPSLNDLEKTLILDDNNIPYSVDILRSYGLIK